MSPRNILTSRRKNQSNNAVKDRRIWWRRMAIVSLSLMGVATSYQLIPRAIEGWTTIQHVSISGVKLMKRGEILSLLALSSESSLWTIDPAALQQRLEAHPRIASASVGRALPHTLAIVIAERQPAATVEHAGGQLFVDQDGVVLSIASEGVTSELPTFSGLSPIRLLEGKAETRDRTKLGVKVARLLQERFYTRVHVDFSNPNEVVARTDDVAFRVNHNVQQVWQQYLALEPTILAGLSTEPYEIDLRYSDKVIVRQRG